MGMKLTDFLRLSPTALRAAQGRGRQAAALVLVWIQASALAATPSSLRPNILLLLVDDLKPALGCYGDTSAKSPNIDRLAATGLRFDLAYCNQAVCAPSRLSLMLGSHPSSTGLYHLHSRLRAALPDAVTLPQHCARHGGYQTESIGKVFHIGHGNDGDAASFNRPHFGDKVIEYLDPASTPEGRLTREEALFSNRQLDRIAQLPRGPAFEAPDVGDDDYADGRVAAETIRRLQAAGAQRRAQGTPFLIAAGFVRPHLPFSVPKKYWDQHDPTSLPAPPTADHPAGSPAVAHKRGGEIAAYSPVPASNEPFPPDLQRRLIHGYYASVSYVDAQIGRVLDALDAAGMAETTIVILWGDHGFHLGDHGIWTKHTNYEQANRIPLIIRAPGVTTPGFSTSQLAESVDLFPTLCELAGLPAPAGPQPIDGISLVPVLKQPSRRLRDHAFHVFPRGQVLGRAIRTERHRLVEWRKPGAPPESAEIELYDYEADPQESTNLAATQSEVVTTLRTRLAQYPEPLPVDSARGTPPPGKVAR